jgi:hypothetical protein
VLERIQHPIEGAGVDDLVRRPGRVLRDQIQHAPALQGLLALLVLLQVKVVVAAAYLNEPRRLLEPFEQVGRRQRDLGASDRIAARIEKHGAEEVRKTEREPSSDS